jgi:hypothetical protein|tara:strand:+ start:386 stop:586 length:201 start_codon:yes stop_codon:yes gene_type:complete
MKQLRYQSTKLYNDPGNPQWVAPTLTAVLFVLFGGAFWISLNGTLDQMTERDCRLGVQAACEQLNK